MLLTGCLGQCSRVYHFLMNLSRKIWVHEMGELSIPDAMNAASMQ